MSGIEDLLRDTFREVAAKSPATEGIADQAIRRGRRARRSRAIGGSLLAVVGVAVLSVGIAALASRPGSVVSPGPSGVGASGTSAPPPSVSPVALPVDVIVGDRLLLAGGREVSLADILSCPLCRLDGAWRVPDGWLIDVYQVSGPYGTDTSTLWHVSEVGETVPLVVGEGPLLVSPGTRYFPGVLVAWIADGRLWLGRHTDTGVTVVASTPAPFHYRVGDLDASALYPQAIVGEAVVLAGTRTGGGQEIWDVWLPRHGDYTPAEYPRIFVHAVTTDRERIIGWFSPDDSKTGCLGELDPITFIPSRDVCPSPVGDGVPIIPSPDGRWWVALGMHGVALHEVDRVWTSWGSERLLLQPDEPFAVAWIDAESFAVVRRSGLSIVHTDGRPTETLPMDLGYEVAQAAVVVDLR